jgi:hypothetical protein
MYCFRKIYVALATASEKILAITLKVNNESTALAEHKEVAVLM